MFGGPRPGELMVEADVPDETPEGITFLDLVESAEEKRVEQARGLLGKGSSPYNQLREKLGTLLSLVDRLGSCWWGCSGGDHTVEYAVAASGGNTFAALRLLRAGYYDEALGLARQIGERANLLQLFMFNSQSLREWSDSGTEARQKKFSAFNIRIELEKLGIPPIIQRDYYHYLSGFGIHPGRIPQSFGDKLPPSVGGLFRLRGLTIVLHELAYVISMVGGTGAVLLSDDERIPADRIVGAAMDLLDDQRKLSKVIDEWISKDPVQGSARPQT